MERWLPYLWDRGDKDDKGDVDREQPDSIIDWDQPYRVRGDVDEPTTCARTYVAAPGPESSSAAPPRLETALENFSEAGSEPSTPALAARREATSSPEAEDRAEAVAASLHLRFSEENLCALDDGAPADLLEYQQIDGEGLAVHDLTQTAEVDVRSPRGFPHATADQPGGDGAAAARLDDDDGVEALFGRCDPPSPTAEVEGAPPGLEGAAFAASGAGCLASGRPDRFDDSGAGCLASQRPDRFEDSGCLSSSPALGGAALFLEYDPPSGSPPPPPEEIVEDDRDLAATPPRLAKREQAYWSAPALGQSDAPGEPLDLSQSLDTLLSLAVLPQNPRSHLDLWLERRGLGKYAAAIRHLGARKVSDLAHLENGDLDDMGMTPWERADIRISVG